MKRKFKLFATVASLCLSVALMAFGVYAAAQVTYTINGSVSYTMNDVLVTVTTKTAYVTNDHAGHADGAVTELSYANETPVGTPYQSYDSSEVATGDGTHTEPVTVSFNTSTAWRITITVETINPNGVEVALGNPTFGIEGDVNYAVVAAEDNPYDTQIVEDGSDDFVFYVYLEDPTVAIDTASFSIVLNITQYAA